MGYRLARREDVSSLIAIVQDAKEYMKENGFTQWDDTYPKEEHILADIEKEECYLWEDQGKILGMTAICFGGEPIYDGIRGKWNTKEPYGTIHRFAVSKEARGTGVALGLLSFAEQLCKEKEYHGIRVDTFRKNNTMKRFLEKHGYTQCGSVYYGEKRAGLECIAYDKVLT